MGINPRPLLSIDNPNQKDPSSGSVKLQLSGTSFSCQNATTTCSDTEESQTECQDHATFDQDEIFRYILPFLSNVLYSFMFLFIGYGLRQVSGSF